jgi:CBS domain containing-hemolysin-like protein
VVAVEDVVEEIVGDIVSIGEQPVEPPTMVGLGQWRVSGDVSVHDWAEAFGQQLIPRRVATLGGLVSHMLGRAPMEGDVVDLGNVRIEVETVENNRVVSALIHLASTEEGGRNSDVGGAS